GLKSRYPLAKTTMGLSNISYGLPNRDTINRAFLIMSIAAGLDSAILNPLDAKIMSLAKVGDMLVGKDPGCKAYVKAHRKGLIVD
ncbi:methyltetrahydrofolate cobalamin methyltransferase, partial [Chloroflexota bacterium]